jgi:hypothetical protein
LDRAPVAAGLQIDEVRHIAGRNLKAKRVSLDLGAARNCARVHTEATVVVSFMVTSAGGVAPTTVKSAALGIY